MRTKFYLHAKTQSKDALPESMILFCKANLLIKSNDKDYSSQNNVNILFEALHKNASFSKNCNIILKITALFLHSSKSCPAFKIKRLCKWKIIQSYQGK